MSVLVVYQRNAVDLAIAGLGVAGRAPEYDCYFAHKDEPLFQYWLVYSNFLLQEIAQSCLTTTERASSRLVFSNQR